MVDGSDALSLEGYSLTIVVVCLRFFLELVRFYIVVIIYFSSQGCLIELGGKYKGIHPHLSLHHVMLTYYWFNKGLLREV
jgi:hypothetical protein